MELNGQNDWLNAIERITQRLEAKIKAPRRDTSMITTLGPAGELTLLSAMIPVSIETKR